MRIRRLLSFEALPGWVLFVWKLIGFASRVEYVEKKMQSLWEFSQTPSGTVTFIFAAVAWLTLVAVWPELKNWWKSSSLQEKAQETNSSPFSNLTVDYAGYGLGPGQYRNVTDQVRSLVKDDKLQIIVGPESLQCEVYSGKPGKHLLVI